MCLESGAWSLEAADSCKALMAPQSSAQVFKLVLPKRIFSPQAPFPAAGIWEVAMAHMDSRNRRRQKSEGTRAGDTTPTKTKIALHSLLYPAFLFSLTPSTCPSHPKASAPLSCKACGSTFPLTLLPPEPRLASPGSLC